MFFLSFSISLSLFPFLSPTCACLHTRAHDSPRSRARTRKPALQCAAQEPLTVPVSDCDRCRSAGCLRRGHLPPPVTAPIPAAQSGSFPPLNFCNVWRFLFPAPIPRLFFFFYRVNKSLKNQALLDFQLGAWWHGYLWQDWKVALRQGAWVHTLKAFYNRVTGFNMRAGESPVEWEARKLHGSPGTGKERRHGGNRDLCGGLRYGGRRERTDETTWVSNLSEGLSHFETVAIRGCRTPGVLRLSLFLVESTCFLNNHNMDWFFFSRGASESVDFQKNSPNLSRLIPALRADTPSVSELDFCPICCRYFLKLLNIIPV